MAASLKARVAKQNFQTYVEANFPEAVARSVLETAANPSAVLKAPTAPALTAVAGWATELADHAIGPVAILSPLSAFSQLASPPRNVAAKFQWQFSRNASERSAGRYCGGFIGESSEIPVRKGRLVAGSAAPGKIGIISTYTREMARRPGKLLKISCAPLPPPT